MTAEKSVNTRISNELNDFIRETINRVTPLLQRINILGNDEELGYVAASRMVALKLRKYTMPFNDDIIKELVQIAKENGGKK